MATRPEVIRSTALFVKISSTLEILSLRRNNVNVCLAMVTSEERAMGAH